MLKDADASYILNLCDLLLEETSFRNYRFPFLVGDRGKALPVAAYYSTLNLVIEYHEGPYREAPYLGSFSTLNSSGRPNEQFRYGQRKRDVLLEQGISLVELYAADFTHDARGRLKRSSGPVRSVLQPRLEPFTRFEEAVLQH